MLIRQPHAEAEMETTQAVLQQIKALESEMAQTQAAEMEMIHAVLQQIKALESEKAQTQALVAQKQSLLLEQRRGLYSKLNSLSPVDKLPVEIKTEIFYNTLPVHPTPKYCKDKGTEMHPFFLGKICRGWRQFVWSTPVLWTILHLWLSVDRYDTQTELLREWLSRTAECPISFCLDMEVTNTTPWVHRPPVEVLAMLASVSAQWKEVKFFLPNTHNCLDVIGAAEKSLPLLTTATVWFMPTELQLNLFSMTPQLSALHLCNHRNMRNVLAPWHQLREFTLKTESVEDIGKLLLKMPNLVRCSFKWIIPVELRDLGVSNPSQFHTLEHLECLELNFYYTAKRAPQILSSFKFPSLREVSLVGPFSTPLAWSPIMTSFHSSHFLEKFSWSSAITSDSDLIQILQLIPSIKELRLELDDEKPYRKLLTADLLQRLCPPHAAKFLPNLRSLTYNGPSSLKDHMDLFRDALVYRFRRCGLQLQPAELDSAVSQIQSVFVETLPELDIDPGIQEDLDSLRREGLELSLYY